MKSIYAEFHLFRLGSFSYLQPWGKSNKLVLQSAKFGGVCKTHLSRSSSEKNVTNVKLYIVAGFDLTTHRYTYMLPSRRPCHSDILNLFLKNDALAFITFIMSIFKSKFLTILSEQKLSTDEKICPNC
jgi:hypothetical protein